MYDAIMCVLRVQEKLIYVIETQCLFVAFEYIDIGLQYEKRRDEKQDW